MGSYVSVAHALLEALEEDAPAALAGGVAVAAHGYIRGTKDVDILVGLPLQEAQRRLAARGITTALHKGDPLEGDFSCLKGSLDGIPFDIIPQIVPVDWNRLIRVEVGNTAVRVVAIEALLALKLRAGAARDVLDVAMLALIHPACRDLALSLADRYRQRDRLEVMLQDPRNLAAARDGDVPAATLADLAPPSPPNGDLEH